MRSSTLSGKRPTESAFWVLVTALPVLAVIRAHEMAAPEATGEVLRSVRAGAAWAAVLIAGLVLTVGAALAATFLRRGTVRFLRLAASPRTWIATAVVAYFVLLTALASRVAPLPVFDLFEHHWQGKIVDLIWLTFLFAMFWRWARTEAGLRWSIDSGSAAPAWTAIGGVFALFVALSAAAVAADPSAASAVSLERIAYDATIPNLTEELIWRAANSLAEDVRC